MTRRQSTLERQNPWNSRRYLTLIHATILSAAASSATFAAPKSARLVALNKVSGKPVASAWLWRSASAAAGTGVLTEDAVVFIEDQQWLKSMDLRTGKLRWQAKLPAPVVHTPVAGEEIALVYTRDQIWAYALANGTRVWVSQLPDDDFAWSFSPEARPTVGEDGLIFVCSGKRVAALRVIDGQMAWMYEHPSIREKQTPIVEMDRIFVRTTNDAEPWLALTPAEGLFVDGSGHAHDGPRPERPHLAPAIKSASRATISPDRRTLSLSLGRRAWKYRVAAPFTIAGVVGETDDAICIQIVETSAPVAPARQAAVAR